MTITELEQEFAKKIGVKYCIGVNSGTSALHACLYAMGVQSGDEVISPALTVIMNTFVTLYLDATPIYVDINPNTFVVEASEIAKYITPKTKAIQIVSLSGQPCDITPIMELADKHGIPILEDNCQCFLGKYKDGRTVGSVATMSVFSTESSKHISSGEGGFICTNDESLAYKARKFAGLGYRTLTASEGRPKLKKELFHDPHFKRHDMVGFNYRLPQACIDLLVPQIQRLEEIVERRVRNGKAFDAILSTCPYFKLQQSEGCINTYWSCTVSYNGPISWMEFYDRFRKNGGEGFHGSLSIPYREPVMNERLPYPVSCPIAENLQPTLMLFHTNYKTDEALNVQIDALQKTIKELGW